MMRLFWGTAAQARSFLCCNLLSRNRAAAPHWFPQLRSLISMWLRSSRTALAKTPWSDLVHRRSTASGRPCSRTGRQTLPRCLSRDDRARPSAAVMLLRRVIPVAAFVLAMCPAPPVGTQTSRHCPAANIATSCLRTQAGDPSTCGTLPHCSVSSTRTTSRRRRVRAPAITPAATVIPGLDQSVIRPITSLGASPQPCAVCPRSRAA